MTPSPILRCLFAGLAVAVGIAASSAAVAADGRLYPSGPPNGVAYLRFVNLTPQPVTVVSPAAKIAIPADDAQRIREFDPVPPNQKLTGSVQLGSDSKPIDLTLQPNEFVTVAASASADAGLVLTVFREVPADFNAMKSSLGLFNLDRNCSDAALVAGDNHQSVVSGVVPGAIGRRMVNPVNVELAAACGDPAQAVPAKLGALVAGDRYSIFVLASASGRQVVAQRDEQAPFRP